MTSPFPIIGLPDAIKARFEDAFDNPVFFMANPAFAMLIYDSSTQGWIQSPIDAWTHCADAVGWDGVLPTTCIFRSSAGSTTCMVALKTSQIWQRLADVSDSSLQGDARCLLSNVGRREWKRLCDSAGIAYGLEKSQRVANAVKEEQETVGGKGAYGTSATTDGLVKSRLIAHKLVQGKYICKNTTDTRFHHHVEDQAVLLSSVSMRINLMTKEQFRALRNKGYSIEFVN